MNNVLKEIEDLTIEISKKVEFLDDDTVRNRPLLFDKICKISKSNTELKTVVGEAIDYMDICDRETLYYSDISRMKDKLTSESKTQEEVEYIRRQLELMEKSLEIDIKYSMITQEANKDLTKEVERLKTSSLVNVIDTLQK